ncbi:MAG: hypothetical protein KDC46_08805 [Thermoleophilia bacterium]|nr:hypothetical protein [Thermoleophilia bacterium]
MRKLLIAVVVLLVIGIVAFGVRTLGARDETDKVDAKDAASLVGNDGSSDIEAGDRPEAGTYSYTGSGRESVSALGGSEHVFPEEVAIVVTLDPEDDCAWTSNVVYVKQHIEERRFCTKGGEMIDRGFTRKINFFNQLQTTEYECGDDAIRLRTDSQQGDTWEWTCREGDKSTSVYTATALGKETMTVGGEQVDVWHTKVVSKQTGDTNGGDTSEFWLTETGLPVKFTGNLKVKTKSVLGDTDFQEKFTYALTSLVPSDAST